MALTNDYKRKKTKRGHNCEIERRGKERDKTKIPGGISSAIKIVCTANEAGTFEIVVSNFGINYK